MKRTISRRDIWRLGLILLGAKLVSACAPFAPDTPTDKSELREAPAPTSTLSPEIPAGPFPDRFYNQAIVDASLQAYNFERVDPETLDDDGILEVLDCRGKKAVEFLSRYLIGFNAMGNSAPSFPLQDYRIIPDNYPLAIDGGSTILDFCGMFVSDLGSGAVRIIPDKGTDMTAGQSSTVEFSDGRWRITRSNIAIQRPLLGLGTLWVDDDFYYPAKTDVEIVLDLMHEYTHTVQDRIFFVKYATRLAEVGDDKHKMNEELHACVAEENEAIAQSLLADFVATGFPQDAALAMYNEVQAETMKHLFLHSLEALNGSKPYAGTSIVNPPKKFMDIVEEQTGQRYVNKHQTFLNYVVHDRNALSPFWVAAINGY